jgi:hypothetical protein
MKNVLLDMFCVLLNIFNVLFATSRDKANISSDKKVAKEVLFVTRSDLFVLTSVQKVKSIDQKICRDVDLDTFYVQEGVRFDKFVLPKDDFSG